jgi:hypothetical protein
MSNWNMYFVIASYRVVWCYEYIDKAVEGNTNYKIINTGNHILSH